MNMRTGDLVSVILASAGALVLSWVLLKKVLRIAYAHKLYDQPNERSSHTLPVPRLGGLSFLPSILFGLALAAFLSPLLVDETPLELYSSHLHLLLATLILYVTGIFDDLSGLKASFMAPIQMLAAILLVLKLPVAPLSGFEPLTHLPHLLQMALLVIAVMLVVNAFNLIDGLDGLAASFVVLSMGFYLLLFTCLGTAAHSCIAVFACAVIATLIPFLYYNVWGRSTSQTKLFMGDTGALTLGTIVSFFWLQSLSLPSEVITRLDVAPLALGAAPLLLPMFDTARLFFLRIYRHRSPFSADRHHIHHYLLDQGYSQAKTRLIILLSAVLLGVLHLVLLTTTNVWATLVLDYVAYLAFVGVVARRLQAARSSVTQ